MHNVKVQHSRFSLHVRLPGLSSRRLVLARSQRDRFFMQARIGCVKRVGCDDAGVPCSCSAYMSVNIDDEYRCREVA